MRQRIHHRATAGFLLFGLAACGFNAPEPKRTPPPPAPPVPLSTLTATFIVKASDIAAALDAKTKDQIAHLKNALMDCAIAKCHLDLVATRNGPVAANAENGRVAISLPFNLSADILFKTGAHSDATGTINAVASLRLGPDWRLQPNTQGSVSLSNGVLKLGPLSMTVTQLWNSNQDRLSAPLFRAFDRYIASDIKVKPQAQRLWHKAFEPFRVAKKPEAWLMLAPERLRVGTPQTIDNAVVLSLGVDVRAHVIVGGKPPAPQKDPPLPAPAPLSAAPANSFRFSVPMLVPYAEAEKLALQRLHDRPLHVKGVLVKFSELHILPSGQDVIVKARFCVAQGWDPFSWFDSCGTGYLRGVPQFDAKAGIIRIAHVHYDVATADMLLAAMRLLAGDELGHELEQKLVFKVSGDLAKLEDQIRAALAKSPSRGVSIVGNVISFSAPTLTWTKEGFLAFLSATGTVKADLNVKP